MGAIIFNDKAYSSGSAQASDSIYDNTDSGLTADNIQDAVDEVVDALDGKQDALTNPLTQSDVVNNLTSTSTVLPLSAAMGKSLKDFITNITRTSIQIESGVSQYGVANFIKK